MTVAKRTFTLLVLLVLHTSFEVHAQDGKDLDTLRKAAEAGDAEAQFKLGAMYRHGEGVEQDYEEAIVWFRKAAAQLHAKAQFNLGYLHAMGQGVEQDYQAAVAWYRKFCGGRLRLSAK